MNKQIWKPVMIGILLGVFLYIVPFFFFRFVLFFLFIGLLLRFIFGRRMWWGRPWYGSDDINPAFADAIRRMSDEEYERFKKKFDNRRMAEE